MVLDLVEVSWGLLLEEDKIEIKEWKATNEVKSLWHNSVVSYTILQMCWRSKQLLCELSFSFLLLQRVVSGLKVMAWWVGQKGILGMGEVLRPCWGRLSVVDSHDWVAFLLCWLLSTILKVSPWNSAQEYHFPQYHTWLF